jgi:hypothetical protein
MSFLSAQGQIPDNALSYNIPAGAGGGGGSSTLLTQVLPIGNYVFSVSVAVTGNVANTITTATLELFQGGVVKSANTQVSPAFNPRVFLSGIVTSNGTTPVVIVLGAGPAGVGGWTSSATKLYVSRIV